MSLNLVFFFLIFKVRGIFVCGSRGLEVIKYSRFWSHQRKTQAFEVKAKILNSEV